MRSFLIVKSGVHFRGGYLISKKLLKISYCVRLCSIVSIFKGFKRFVILSVYSYASGGLIFGFVNENFLNCNLDVSVTLTDVSTELSIRLTQSTYFLSRLFSRLVVNTL